MTLDDANAKTAAAAKAGRREKRPRLAPGEAVEIMLLNAHRVAVIMTDSGVFQESKLSLAEWAILKAIDGRQDLPLRKLQAAGGVSRQRMRKVLAELEAKRLVAVRQSDSNDKRSRSISATPAAASTLAAVSEGLQKLLPDSIKERRGRAFAGAAGAMEQLAGFMLRAASKEKPNRKGLLAEADKK
jgi:DNA-binding MarR family transcriptional regulator